MKPTLHQARGGFSRYQVLVWLLVFGAAAAGISYFMRQKAMAEEAASNLRQIYSALGLYEIDRGYLPNLAFFPDDPRYDEDSLLVVLGKYGVSEQLCINPVAPPAIQAVGMNYVWNTRLNGATLNEPGQTDWLLASVECLSPQVPPPFLGRYLVLYTDGKVSFQRHPPPGLERP